jgi:hypothetical protein
MSPQKCLKIIEKTTFKNVFGRIKTVLFPACVLNTVPSHLHANIVDLLCSSYLFIPLLQVLEEDRKIAKLFSTGYL